MIFFKRIHDISENYLEVGMMALHSSFNYLAIFNSLDITLSILSPIKLAQHFMSYKQAFQQTKNYKLTTLPALRSITMSKESQVIRIRFIQVQGQIRLIVGYYNGVIEIYSQKGWKIIKKFYPVDYMIDFFTDEKILYVMDYSREVKCFDLVGCHPNVQPCIFSNILTIHNTKQGLIMETIQGQLLDVMGKLIMNHHVSKLMSQSVTIQAYERFQTDFSGQYLILKDLKTIYQIKSMKSFQFQQHFDCLSISPFEYMEGKIALMATEQTLLLISIQKKGKQYVEISNVKRPTKEIQWIGPFQVLIVDEQEKLYYLQFFSQSLILKQNDFQ